MKVKSIALAAVLAAFVAGTANAGAACRDVLRYLKADVEDLRQALRGKAGAAATIRKHGIVLRWGAKPPKVLYMAAEEGERASAADKVLLRRAKSDTEFVVWMINKALSHHWQLRLGPTTEGKFERGVIKVLYLPHEYWPPSIARSGARALVQYTKYGQIDTAVILLDPDHVGEERHRVHFLLHEMLHALGRSHVDRDWFSETVMHAHAYRSDGMGILKDLDKAALRAVYSPRVPIGTRIANLECDGQGRIARKDQ